MYLGTPCNSSQSAFNNWCQNSGMEFHFLKYLRFLKTLYDSPRAAASLSPKCNFRSTQHYSTSHVIPLHSVSHTWLAHFQTERIFFKSCSLLIIILWLTEHKAFYTEKKFAGSLTRTTFRIEVIPFNKLHTCTKSLSQSIIGHYSPCKHFITDLYFSYVINIAHHLIYPNVSNSL